MKNPNSKQTLIALKEFSKSSTELQLERLQQQLSPLAREIESGKYTIVIAGEVKKGKSSLINALLQIGNLLPIASDIATSTAFRVIYGPERKNTVYFKPAATQPGVNQENFEALLEHVSNEELQVGKVINNEDLITYGTEFGNPENNLQVDYIKIEIPNDVLQSGLEIIDTPGLGGVLPYHSQLTWKYIPTADAVLFVFDSIDSPITIDEAEWIGKIKNFTSLIVFAQTKTDSVSSEQWKAWQDRNLDQLTEIIGKKKEEIFYFPVSSRLRAESEDKLSKFYERSGFVSFEEFFFNQLHQQVIGKKCKNALDLLRNGLSRKNQKLAEETRVIEEDSIENLESLKKHYAAILNNLKELETRVYPDLKEDFSIEIDRVMEDGMQAINQFLHQSQVNPEIRKFIDELQRQDASPKYINKNIDQIASRFIDNLSQKVLIFYKTYQNEIIELVDKHMDMLLDYLQESNVLNPDLENNSVGKDSFLKDEKRDLKVTNQPPAEKIKFNGWDATRNYVMGAGLGTSLGTAAGYAILILFPPALIYAALVGVTGTVLGTVFSGISARQKNEKQILNHLQSILFGLMAHLQRKVVYQFREDIRDVKRQANKEFKRIIRETRDFNDRQLIIIKQQIDQGGKATQGSINKTKQQANIVRNLLEYIEKIS